MIAIPLVIGLVGAAFQAMQSIQQGKAAQKGLEAEARNKEIAAKYAMDAAKVRASRIEAEGGRTQSTAIAGAGYSGVEVGSGSVIEGLKANVMETHYGMLTAINEGQRNEWGYREEARALRYKGSVERSKGTMGAISAGLNFGSTLATGGYGGMGIGLGKSSW